MDLPDNALTNIFFSGFLDSLAVVRHLRVVSKRIGGVGRESMKLLDLHGTAIRDSDLLSMTMAFPHITVLDLRFCKNLGDGVGRSLEPCRGTLTSLSLRGVRAGDAALADLSTLPRLTTLDLSKQCQEDRDRVSGEAVQALAEMPRLTSLNLAWNVNVDDEAVEGLTSKLSKLRVLDVALCKGITTRGLMHIARLHNLRHLSLTGCTQATDEGLLKILAPSGCPRLERLHVSHCHRLTGRVLLALLEEGGDGGGGGGFGAPCLRELALQCCEQITAQDVTRLRLARPAVVVSELRSW